MAPRPWPRHVAARGPRTWRGARPEASRRGDTTPDWHAGPGTPLGRAGPNLVSAWRRWPQSRGGGAHGGHVYGASSQSGGANRSRSRLGGLDRGTAASTEASLKMEAKKNSGAGVAQHAPPTPTGRKSRTSHLPPPAPRETTLLPQQEESGFLGSANGRPPWLSQ